MKETKKRSHTHTNKKPNKQTMNQSRKLPSQTIDRSKNHSAKIKKNQPKRFKTQEDWGDNHHETTGKKNNPK